MSTKLTPEFEAQFKELRSAWLNHQQIRESKAGFDVLAASASRLHQARADIWGWNRTR